MNSIPKVSVCIPTYNYANYLPLAIESVLGQGFKDFELIVQDDCSSDNTEEVISKYLSDPRVKFGVNQANLGLAGNWNRCLELASGQYIKYLCADDLLASGDALERMVSILDADPKVSLVASSRNVIDARGGMLHVLTYFERDEVFDGKEMIRRCLRMQHNIIGEPTVVMFRRKQGKRGFNPQYQHLLDLEMWLYLLEQGNMAYLHTPLSSFRVHDNQKTNDNIEHFRYIDDFCLFIKEYHTKPYLGWGALIRNYQLTDSLYKFWKSQKRGALAKKEALARIEKHLPLWRFFLTYPIYKTVKPFVRAYLRVTSLDGKNIRHSIRKMRLKAKGFLQLVPVRQAAPAVGPPPDGRKIPLPPADQMRHIGGDESFRIIGREFFNYFVKYAGLRPNETVLDVGCGIGRIAVPLTEYLSGQGKYRGFDISQTAIQWCRANISSRFPSFTFEYADVYNAAYNPSGIVPPDGYVFPYKSSFFDFVFLTSVFTHMLPRELEHYMNEIARVLKPGGRCFITYFLLDAESRELSRSTALDFRYDIGGCFTNVERMEPDVPIAYEKEWVLNLHAGHGFEIVEPILYGNWSGRKESVSHQDIIISRKPKAI